MESYHRRTGRQLITPGADMARALYEAPFAVLAHDTAPDPVFFCANLTAQRLFEMSWAEITALPSRHSAEPVAQEMRQRLLDRVTRDGFIDDYEGARVSKSGRRFHISGATVWTLSGGGQAATFAAWRFL